MLKVVLSALLIVRISFIFSQATVNSNTGDAYLLFGPNTNWSQYFQVGGNGRVTSHASIFATNGNLHLDAKDGSFSTYINYYSTGNTILNAQGGNVGIGTAAPTSKLEVFGDIKVNNPNTRGGSFFKIERGDEGKDAAVVAYGENGEYKWYTGMLYNGGVATPDFYISQKSDIRSGGG